jgi:hypothetical protein
MEYIINIKEKELVERALDKYKDNRLMPQQIYYAIQELMKNCCSYYEISHFQTAIKLIQSEIDTRLRVSKFISEWSENDPEGYERWVKGK